MKALKILILFVVLLSGCSKKYLVSTEEELISRKSLSTWEDLDANVIGRNENSFALNLRVKDFAEVREVFCEKEIYKRGSKQKDGSIKQDAPLKFKSACATAGCAGILGFVSFLQVAHTLPDVGGWGYLSAFSFIGGGIGALCFLADGLLQKIDSADVKVKSVNIKMDTICVDSLLLSKEKVKIMFNDTDFEKEYYTDEDGNIELKFSEIVPEPVGADSIINLIIQYEEMVDNVDVKIR